MGWDLPVASRCWSWLGPVFRDTWGGPPGCLRSGESSCCSAPAPRARWRWRPWSRRQYHRWGAEDCLVSGAQPAQAISLQEWGRDVELCKIRMFHCGDKSQLSAVSTVQCWPGVWCIRVMLATCHVASPTLDQVTCYCSVWELIFANFTNHGMVTDHCCMGKNLHCKLMNSLYWWCHYTS